MLLMTFIIGGPHAALRQSMGLLAAHMYDFLTRLWPTFGGGKNYIQTPALFRGWFGGDQRRSTTKAYGTAIRPGVQATGRTTSSSFGFGGSWAGRGQGHRLGGD